MPKFTFLQTFNKLTFLFLFIFSFSHAQDGSLDTSFDPGSGANISDVRSVVVQPDGKILIGGAFTTYNGTNINRIARLNADGSLDTTFNPGSGANNTVWSIALQPDGKILIGGEFTFYDGTSRNRIARLNADGTLDSTFNGGTEANNAVFSVALQPDGKIIIGGQFTSYNGTTRRRLARLNSSGSLDNTFNTGTGVGNNAVITVAVQPDGKILIGGSFTSFNGTGRNRIARTNTDGSLDSTFSIGTGPNSVVNAFGIQPDGKILIGGSFTSYNGIGRNRIARLNLNGSLDTTFNPGSGANNTLWSIYVLPDGGIHIGGLFTSYNGTGRSRIAKLNTDGSLYTAFDPGIGPNGAIFSFDVQPDGKIIIGGQFLTYNGINRTRIARINVKCANTSTWTASTWNNGAPTLNNKVIINADYDTAVNGSFDACELIINGGHTLTISPNTTVLVKNGIDTKPTGNLIIEDTGNLAQVEDDAVNVGNITVKRNTTPVTKFDFTYWSSPVSGQTLFNVSPNTLRDKYFSFDTAVQNWKTEMNGASVMAPGVGYIIRSPQSFSNTTASVYNATFVGSPNNGVVNVNIPLNAATTGNFALIGNPYPSAVDADLFINQNAGVLKGALYFWTHNTPISNNIYNANDYAVYTLMGGVGTSGNPIPSGRIASGQGFFVDLADGLGTSTTLTFNNSMRVSAAGQNAQFFAANQSRADVELPASTTTISTQPNSKSRLWLNLTNNQGAFSQTMFGYTDAATNGYDRLFDGLFLDGFENVISFYSLLQDQWLSIQAKAMPFDNKDIIPLGYKSTIAGTFTISIADLDGLFGDQDVVLEDKLTGTTHLLKESDYTFTTEIGTFNNRFVISFANKTLSTDDFVTNESVVQIFSKGNQLTIKSANEPILSAAVYDITGRKLYYKSGIILNELNLPLQKSNQLLIVNIELEGGSKITKKIQF